MIDPAVMQPVIRQIFKGSGSATLSKRGILSRLSLFPLSQKYLPVLRQVPDRNDYTEYSLTEALHNLGQKEASRPSAGNVQGEIAG